MMEFLIILALAWLVIASYCDLKKREVPNWLSFSLIIFAFAYRAFYSLFFSDLWFFAYGLLGFLIFVGLAYAFYYARIFAGGDAKLLMGLGVVLPGNNLYGLINLGIFVLLLIFIGGFYGLIYSFFLVLGKRKEFFEEFPRQFKAGKNLFFVAGFFVIFSLGFAFYLNSFLLFAFPFLFMLFPLLYVYGKAVEESCLIKDVNGKELTIGDWLYKEIKIGKKKIKPYWEGLSEEEVKLLRKQKKVKIKQGIPFVPVFLIAFVLLLYLKNAFINFLNFYF